MRRWVPALLLALALGACVDTDSGRDGQQSTWVEVVPLPDGGQVVCVIQKHGYSGGITCDWDGLDGRD
jgi:hypothetical protein